MHNVHVFNNIHRNSAANTVNGTISYKKTETYRYLLMLAVPNSRMSPLFINRSVSSFVMRSSLTNVPSLEVSLICSFGIFRTSACKCMLNRCVLCKILITTTTITLYPLYTTGQPTAFC